MCTVTFIPQADQGFILSSNRDEQADRSPQNITIADIAQQKLLFPRDAGAGGTWIAVSDQNKMLCLLNGAFEIHQRQLPYRLSRGVMVLDFFNYPEAKDFMAQYNLENIEPFTLVIYDRGALYELRWDGIERYIKVLDPQQIHIWSSATLYSKEVREKREKWFADWQQKNEHLDLTAILDFHKNAGEGDPWNDVIMNRLGIVETVSITNVVGTAEAIQMLYHDLVNNKIKQEKIYLKGEVVESN